MPPSLSKDIKDWKEGSGRCHYFSRPLPLLAAAAANNFPARCQQKWRWLFPAPAWPFPNLSPPFSPHPCCRGETRGISSCFLFLRIILASRLYRHPASALHFSLLILVNNWYILLTDSRKCFKLVENLLTLRAFLEQFVIQNQLSCWETNLYDNVNTQQ